MRPLYGVTLAVVRMERQVLVDRGFAMRDDWALQTMKDLPHDKGRVYDPHDTLRY